MFFRCVRHIHNSSAVFNSSDTFVLQVSTIPVIKEEKYEI